jgi:hypothetical protein
MYVHIYMYRRISNAASFNRIDLPAYKTKAELEEKLTRAIEETEGFGLE